MEISETVDKISESALITIQKYMMRECKNRKNKKLWKDIVYRACVFTEEITRENIEYFLKCSAINKYYILLNSNKNVQNIYHDFIITVAMELIQEGKEDCSCAISLAMAILDNWFEANKIETQKFKERLQFNDLKETILNREKLYKEYFLLFNDEYAKDVIKVYYPGNGKDWIEWNEKYSICINVNLSKGIDWGFCKVGFAYSLITIIGDEKQLILAYLDKDKEVFRFEDTSNINSRNILWAR